MWKGGSALISPELFGGTLILLLVLLGGGWLATTVQSRRHNQGMTEHFATGLRSRMVLAQTVSSRGFVAHLVPPPEPFHQIEVRCRTVAAIDPIGLFFYWVRGQDDHLTVRGQLRERPVAELLWERGRIPERALTGRAHTTLWQRRYSELLASEYAVRGADTGAIEHVFVDLQARFGGLLRRVSLVADREEWQLEVVLKSSELRTADTPALMITLCSLARAALPHVIRSSAVLR